MSSEDSSFLGRYVAQKALRHQSRQDDSLKSNLASVPAVAIMTAGGPVMVPVGMVANELSNNVLVQGKPSEAKRKIKKSEKKVLDRSWKDQILDGLKKSPLWALGGAAGGGLGGYALSGGQAGPTGIAAGGGALAGALTPIASSILTKLILENSSRKTLDKARTSISDSPIISAMPMGDAILAADSSD